MKYVAAYMLLVMGGNKSPSAKDIEKVLSSVGIQAEADRVKQVIDLLNGKSLEELITKGKEKLAAIPSGGVASAAPAAAAEAPKGGAPKAEEKKKEEKKEEEEDEMDGGMGGLFD